MLPLILKKCEGKPIEKATDWHKSPNEKFSGELLRVTKIQDDKNNFEFGEKYPGIVIGQQSCKASNGLVPKYMGWLWNVQSLGSSKLRQGLLLSRIIFKF